MSFPIDQWNHVCSTIKHTVKGKSVIIRGLSGFERKNLQGYDSSILM